MASRALNHFEVEELKANILAADAQDTPVPAATVFRAFVSAGNPDSLPVPTSEGLKPSKGAMIAIGVEAGAALCFYGVWQLFTHILR
ncbi:MAG: hypothetical protein WBQ94_29940 [Terracidiphilus sp.]